ncbi:hypothetical protein [Veillonella sp. 27098_8_77]|uniref:hypothetical protein n=1 Tax=Veillonella sp. 27098_8_77 TaxID=3003642 RepID=UPI00352E7219
MKPKTMLLGVSMALAFTMPINAAQYTVLEGQLPVPGADASIPENAYQNYRYGDTSKVPDFEIKESLKLSFKEIDEIAREPEMSQVNTNALKEANIRYMDLLSHDSTVILLHEKGYNAKLTAPIRTVEGIVTPLKSEGITSFAIDRYAMASLSGTTETPEQAFNESSAGRKGAFTYPGIRAGTWIITDSSKNDNNPTMLAHVIFDDQPNHTYIATLSKFGQSDVVKNLESAMANIVIPSMQSLDTLDSVSDLVTWENITYRVPKGMVLKTNDTNHSNSNKRVYQGHGMEFVIERGPVIDTESPILAYCNRVLHDYLYASPSLLLQDVPIQSAVVWNNGVPSYLMDQYNSGKQSRMIQLIQDDQYEYNMYLTYEDGKANYNHIELRDMMEYLDFGNAKMLRDTMHQNLIHKKK